MSRIPTSADSVGLSIAKHRRHVRPPVIAALVVATVAMLACAVSTAATVSFSTTVNGQTRTATVDMTDKENAAYVPVGQVIDQLGGGWAAALGRAQFDFVGKSAWIRLNGERVNASLNQFSLRRPLLQEGEEILMALSDVIPFFEKAFGLNVIQDISAGAREQTVAAADETIAPDEETVELEDLPEPGMLEPVTLTDRPTSAARRDIRVVVIDAGHGGNDTGCEGQSMKEKDLVLSVARRLTRMLQTSLQGRVLMTRGGDANLPLVARMNFANNHQADLFVSIHAGASLSNSASGFAIYCLPSRGAAGGETTSSRTRDARWAAADYDLQSTEIAESVAAALAEATQANNRGIHKADCRILAGVNMPSMLIEIGCLSNAGEEALFADEAYEAKVAKGMAEGILKHASVAAGANADQ